MPNEKSKGRKLPDAVVSDYPCPECGDNDFGTYVGDGVCWCPLCEREWKPVYMEGDDDEDCEPFQA